MPTVASDATLTAVTEAEQTIQQQLAAAERTRDNVERAHGEADVLVAQAHRDGTQAGDEHAAAIRAHAERQAHHLRQTANEAAQRLSTRVTAQRDSDVELVVAAVVAPT